MNTRTILIQSYAKKNKNHRKKYFVLSIFTNYSDPRLDYFISKEKWIQKRHEIDYDNSENVSYQSIDLSNLFHVDDIYQPKFKLSGLNLYSENRHFSLILQSEDWKKRWKEYFENIIYKNKKAKPYYNSVNIEHVLEVKIRLKPKENIDKSVYSQLRGSFRACFTKSLLMFVNNSLENPALSIQYSLIRQWESRYDGTIRLAIGRAALLGECTLILRLADYEDSKDSHVKLTNCINSFKVSKPDPPKIRSQCDKPSKRISLISCSSKPTSLINNSEIIQKRHDSCITFGNESLMDNRMTSSKSDFRTDTNPSCSTEDSYYLPMNGFSDSSPNKPNNVLNYFEHTNRIYKCPNCSCFTKLIIYCSRCYNIVSFNTLSLLCKPDQTSDPNSLEIQPQCAGPTRNKAQSLTEKPIRFSASCTYKKPFFLDMSKQTTSNNSKSSSKTSTNDASVSSKQESQNSLAISANRHDDELFMEFDFDNLDNRVLSSMRMPTTNRQSSQLKCSNCSTSLIHKTSNDNIFNKRCLNCSKDLVTLSIPIKDALISSDWRPRTTSLVPSIRPIHPINKITTSSITGSELKSNDCSEYVEVTQDM